MVPPFNTSGNLPQGVHSTDWSTFAQHFGWTQRRLDLLAGLDAALTILREAGCRRVYINGSFVTRKDEPGDVDVAWDPEHVDVDRLLELEPVFGDFTDRRAAQKARFGCEFFPASLAADSAGSTFLEFFQVDKESGEAKGIVVLNL